MTKLGNLKPQITEFINYIEQETSEIKTSAKQYIDMLSGRKNSLENDLNFQKYISKGMGDDQKDLVKKIYNEIELLLSEDLSNKRKGIKEWFSLSFSSKQYLENIIDIMMDTCPKKLIVL